MSDVQYENNSVTVKSEMTDAINRFLAEAGGEIQNAAVENSRTATGQTKGSYKYKVVPDSQASTVYIGSDYQNAIWEEYGTGEFALKGNGRKSPWTYKSSDGHFYRTHGKTANRPLHRAFVSTKEKIKRRLRQVLKSL